MRSLGRRAQHAKKLLKKFWSDHTGPRVRSTLPLSRAAFLELFAIDTVARGLAEGDVEKAEAALLEHYARRVRDDWLEPPPEITDLRLRLEGLSDDALVEKAEAVLENDVTPHVVKPRLTAAGMIDWEHNPTGDREWILKINRHAWWVVLALAYKKTGDGRYAAAVVEQMSDWVERNPPLPRKDERSPTWRLMEVGLRQRVSWIPVFGLLYEAPSFTKEAKLRMLRSMCDHARFLRLFKTNRNHLLRESNGLANLGAYLPEFKEARDWCGTALERIEGEICEQVNLDGSHIEMSTGYQLLVIDEFEKTYDLLQARGLALPREELGAWLVKMYRFLSRLVLPGGAIPQFNDGFILWPHTRLALAGKKFQQEDLLFIGTNGAEGSAPRETSVAFPDAGMFIMRSDWSSEAHYLAFDAGPHGGFHGHEDKLSIEVAAHGVRFLADPGSYTYDKKDPFRLYFVGSQGHNTVMVDGKSQVRLWNDAYLNPAPAPGDYARWGSGEAFDYVRATYDEGYDTFAPKRPPQTEIIDDVRHTRHVLFVKPHYWLVLDVLEADAPHTYRWLFHAPAILAVTEGAQGRTTLAPEAGGPRLDLLPAVPGDAGAAPRRFSVVGSEDPVQGWFSSDHHVKEPATALIYELEATGRAALAFLLHPFAAGEAAAPLALEARALGAGAFGCVVTTQRGKDFVLFSDGPGRKELGPLVSEATIAGVRTDAGGATTARFQWQAQ